MRIRIFRAFASNNSGSYTLVGSFESCESAATVEALIRDACAAHSTWHDANEWTDDGEAPLDAFAREHGLHEEKPGRGDAWPMHGPAPEVITVGHQVLLHVPYTVTMPRLFGELFYQHGGRVDLELDHSHDRLAVEFTFHVPDVQWNAAERKERFDAVERDVTPLLTPLVTTEAYERRPPVNPVFHHGEWGSRQLTALFHDLVEGVRLVRETAAKHGVEVRIRVVECPDNLVDPLAALRVTGRPWGRSRVALWAIGADRIGAMKAVRDVTGVDLAEAKAMIDDLPKEIIIDVEHGFAERAAETLRSAGYDAEALIPGPRR